MTLHSFYSYTVTLWNPTFTQLEKSSGLLDDSKRIVGKASDLTAGVFGAVVAYM